MYPKLIKSAFLILFVVVLICCIYVSFSYKNGASFKASQDVLASDQHPDGRIILKEEMILPGRLKA